MTTADELLYAEGIAGTGVQRILDEAEVARGTLYGNFSGKDGLVEAYLQRRHEATLTAITTEIAGRSTPRDVFDAFLAVGERRSQVDGYRGCAFALAVAEMPADGSIARRWAAKHKSALKGILVDALSGTTDGSEADEIAEELMVLYDGALLSTALRPEAQCFAAARRASHAVLARERQ